VPRVAKHVYQTSGGLSDAKTAMHSATVFQSRFSIDGTDGNDTDNCTAPSWIVGLTFTTESSKNFSYARPDVWTNETSNLTVIAAPADPGWYVFNVQCSGEARCVPALTRATGRAGFSLRLGRAQVSTG